MSWSGNGVENMAFTYNIIKAVEEEKDETRAEIDDELIELALKRMEEM